MALSQVNLFSSSLMRTVLIHVILPVDKLPFPGQVKREEKPYKTLYLLHGILGNYTDWVSGTRIQRFAEEYDLAVVMPSGENAFYVDQPDGHDFYGEFVGKELVELTRRMFPLSHKREDTFIAGLSMGGYGAMRNGLKYADTFGCIAALSGAFHLEEMATRSNEEGIFFSTRTFIQSRLGNLSQLLESDKNPKFLVEQRKKSEKPLPKIYMACGDKDGLLESNRDMADFLKLQGADVTFEIGPGAHEWDFWDTYIKRVIQWLPTEKSELGVSSGNVGI